MKRHPLTRCLTVALCFVPALAGAQTIESADVSMREIRAGFKQARVEQVAFQQPCSNPVFFPKNPKAEATFAYEKKTREFRRLSAESRRLHETAVRAGCYTSAPVLECAALNTARDEMRVLDWRAYVEFATAQVRAEFLGGIRRVRPQQREPGDDYEETLVGGKDYEVVCQPLRG